MSADRKLDRGRRFLTVQYVLGRLKWLDEQIADPVNADARRLDYLYGQKQWWEAQLPFAYRREGLLR